jgi:hypothetical protein
MDHKSDSPRRPHIAQDVSAPSNTLTAKLKATAAPRTKRSWLMVVAGLIGVALLFAAYTTVCTYMANKGIAKDKYQAVFLSNGQVYFGKLQNVSGKYVELTDIYYLQVQQSVQPQNKDVPATTDPNVSLAKLGGELHGPENKMSINREHVLFWENLKPDAKVSQAIKKNEK